MKWIVSLQDDLSQCPIGGGLKAVTPLVPTNWTLMVYPSDMLMDVLNETTPFNRSCPTQVTSVCSVSCGT